MMKSCTGYNTEASSEAVRIGVLGSFDGDFGGGWSGTEKWDSVRSDGIGTCSHAWKENAQTQVGIDPTHTIHRVDLHRRVLVMNV